MVGVGFVELIFMLGLLAGGGSLDIASTLPAKEYFKARDIEVSADKLMDLAAQNPDTGKKQIGQLIALAHLANEPELLKKSAKLSEHRRTLGEIAQGKKASDPSGFAVNYAEKVLLALEGKTLPLPAKRSWKESAKFLPENAGLVSLVDLASSQSAVRKLPDLGMIFDVLPKEDKEMFWSSVEKVGNYQIDSVGIALVYDADGGKLAEVVARFTGKGNPDWFVSELTDFKEDTSKVRLGANGEKIRILATGRNGPAIAIIGGTEVLVGGYSSSPNPGGGPQKNHQEVVDRLLAERAKSPLGPIQGLLKDDLAKVPADANGVVAGLLPAEARVGAPFPLPNRILAHAKRIAGGIDVLGQGAMADDKDAKNLIDIVGKGRDQGLQELNKLQGQPLPVPGLNVGVIIGVLESVQLQANGSDAQIRLLVPDDAMTMLPAMFGMRFAAVGRVAPPAPKVEVKKE